MIFDGGVSESYGEPTRDNIELGKIVYAKLSDESGRRIYEWLTCFCGVDSFEFGQQPTDVDVSVCEGRRQVWAAIGHLFGLGNMAFRKEGLE